MHPFEILLTVKQINHALFPHPGSIQTQPAEGGAGGVCFFCGGEIPTSIATRFFITKYHP